MGFYPTNKGSITISREDKNPYNWIVKISWHDDVIGKQEKVFLGLERRATISEALIHLTKQLMELAM